MPTELIVYPGSFDPATNGHLDLIERSLHLFQRVIVAVVSNPNKHSLFTLDERMAMLREVTKEWSDRVEIDSFEGLLVDYMRMKDSCAILRGFRAVSDFEYEFEMALTNRRLCEDIETIFMPPSEEYFFLRASTVKEVAKLGGDVTSFVHPFVAEQLKTKFSNR